MDTESRARVVVALLALCAGLGARPLLAGALGDADTAIRNATAAVEAAEKADAAADRAEAQADTSRVMAELPQMEANATARALARAKAELDAATQALSDAVAALLREQDRQPRDDDAVKEANRKANEAADRQLKAKRALAAAQKDADAAAKANDSEAARAAREKAEADKKAAEAARGKAVTDRAAAQTAISAAEKAVQKVPAGSSRDKREDKVKGLDARLKKVVFGLGGKGATLASLAASGKVAVSLDGTGQTIGHVANLTVKNNTTKTVNGYIAPMFLASGSADYQPYIVPYAGTVSLGPGETKTVPLTGVCADAHKPPVPQGKPGELSIAPETPQTRAMIKGVQDIIMTTERLQLTGAYTTPFSANPGKERETIVQWTTWAFTSAKTDRPVTKADLAKKVHEQAGATTPEQKAALDKGVDQIWGGVQLTGVKAKVL
ncbi:MAG: hypothetical protein FJ290_16835 [Planctomycetes bacterium]|nr:hypothetical protein [Planctomycetota bacterium]